MPESAYTLVPNQIPRTSRRCLACGDALPKRRRRYCTTECQQFLLASLNRRTGLLKALGTRYATFYFTDFVIMMDILLYGLEQIHSYMLMRSPRCKPVEDFRQLSNMLGNLWWDEKNRTRKRYLASRQVLEQARKGDTPLNDVLPVVLTIPSVKASSLVQLRLEPEDLTSANLESTIKSAYRRQALKHHPDLGGNRESFLKIHEAYEKLTQWALHPTFVNQRGFPDKWLYEGARNRWVKPIAPRRRR